MIDTLNQTLFALINAPETASDLMIALATLAAEGLLYIVAVAMVLGWVRGNDALRRALFSAGLAAVFGLALNQIIRSFWLHPRPFAAGFGQQFLEHSADASFPSDHGTILFSIALALLLSKSRFGSIALVMALATAWARVYLGVHWPLDMFGAFGVAMVAAPLASTIFPRPVAAGYALILRLYRGLLKALHLPLSIFPR
jgi:undecaprenyl-diphosphatase